jgi:hypothetical protein
MSKVGHQLIAGPLVGFAVGVGDGLVGQAHFGDRHDNVRSIYRLGVVALGAIGLATGRYTEASLGAMTGAAALVGSRVVPAARGGGWQQFGMVSGETDPTVANRDPGRHPRQSAIDNPYPEPVNSGVPGTGNPGQAHGENVGRWRGRMRAYSVEQAPGLL